MEALVLIMHEELIFDFAWKSIIDEELFGDVGQDTGLFYPTAFL